MLKRLTPNPEYKFSRGVKRATVTVAANATGSAAIALLLVRILRHTDYALWAAGDDDLAATAITVCLTGIPRFIEDWFGMNVLRMRGTQQDGDAP